WTQPVDGSAGSDWRSGGTDRFSLPARQPADLTAKFHWSACEAAYLNLSENAFSELPEQVTLLANLLELRISDNQLTFLPDSIGRLERLRELHLRNNKLASLPESVGQLKELRQIDLRGN